MGAWIETNHDTIVLWSDIESLPSWERGLKRYTALKSKAAGGVAPLVGAWIETEEEYTLLEGLQVAPLVGAWIETCVSWHYTI